MSAIEKYYFEEKGKQVYFEVAPLQIGAGGDASVYKIVRPDHLAATHVFKKYYQPMSISKEAVEKVEYLVNRLGKELRRSDMLWPSHVAYLAKTDRFVGYLMPKGSAEDLWKFLLSKVRNPQPDLTTRMIVCERIASTVTEFHSDPRFVHGDLKLENFLVNSDNEVQLIDLDNVQIDAAEAFYRYSMVTERYLAPEYYVKKTDYDSGALAFHRGIDTFALGVIFYVAIFKIHPFLGARFPQVSATGTDLKARIQDGCFPFGKHRGNCIILAEEHRAFENAHYHLQALFVRALGSGAENAHLRPSAAEWLQWFRSANLGHLGTGLIPNIKSELRHGTGSIYVPWHNRLFRPVEHDEVFPDIVFREDNPDGLYTTLEWQIPKRIRFKILDLRFRVLLENNLNPEAKLRLPNVPRKIRLVALEIGSNRKWICTVQLGALRLAPSESIAERNWMKEMQPDTILAPIGINHRTESIGNGEKLDIDLVRGLDGGEILEGASSLEEGAKLELVVRGLDAPTPMNEIKKFKKRRKR